MVNVPVAIFIFKRIDKSVLIIDAIAKARPSKLYIVSDAGRNEEERLLVSRCRTAVENAITWPCEVVCLYETENQGCHNIGMAALRIFEKEEKCIFLEDDNYPEETFFEYCQEMLDVYEDNDDIMWVCGTNYMTESQFVSDYDCIMTQHMLPCGWASWAKKMKKYYQYDFQTLNEAGIERAKGSYKSHRLFEYDKKNWESEIQNKRNGRYASWDYHMNFSLRYYNKYGIVPRFNQITNIGADEFSAHGGTSMENYMTSKFCMVPSKKLTFPLKTPDTIVVDKKFEAMTERIIVPPRKYYIKIFLRKLLPIPTDISISKSLKKRRIVRKNE